MTTDEKGLWRYCVAQCKGNKKEAVKFAAIMIDNGMHYGFPNFTEIADTEVYFHKHQLNIQKMVETAKYKLDYNHPDVYYMKIKPKEIMLKALYSPIKNGDNMCLLRQDWVWFYVTRLIYGMLSYEEGCLSRQS